MITIQNQLDHAQLIIHCRFNQFLVCDDVSSEMTFVWQSKYDRLTAVEYTTNCIVRLAGWCRRPPTIGIYLRSQQNMIQSPGEHSRIKTMHRITHEPIIRLMKTGNLDLQAHRAPVAAACTAGKRPTSR
jgi:hypothetical protein